MMSTYRIYSEICSPYDHVQVVRGIQHQTIIAVAAGSNHSLALTGNLINP